jgi:hypothetical protein
LSFLTSDTGVFQHNTSLEEQIVFETSPPTVNRPITPGEEEPNNMDELIAKEMDQLSVKERNRVYEDVHGVSDPTEETPEIISSKLEDFTVKVGLIGNKPAYDLALQLNADYVHDKKRLLMFLRADNFDAAKASLRYTLWFQTKLELFGPDLLAKDIQMKDLDADDIFTLNTGRLQLLPSRDKSGRAIFMDMMNLHSSSCRSANSTVR